MLERYFALLNESDLDRQHVSGVNGYYPTERDELEAIRKRRSMRRLRKKQSSFFYMNARKVIDLFARYEVAS